VRTGRTGMHASSTDLKERVVRAVANGQPMREAARRCGVAVTTVKRAVVRQRETGALARKPLPGGPAARRPGGPAARRPGGPELETRLRTRLEAAPEAPVVEHGAGWAEQLGQALRAATMGRAIRRRGGTQQPSRWQPVRAPSRSARRGGKGPPAGTRSSASASTTAAPLPR
jgi:transposase